ncbi:MAG: glycosyltransferase family 39 protein [Butyrivibrio sp.]|nr:glycosyltransferase family 39 protein [Butyrivibrio sp.]
MGKEVHKKLNIVYLWRIITVFFVLLVAARLFYCLGYEGISDDDEAWHVNNAYEMFKTNSWLVNTFNWEADYYNSKPPLGLWPTIVAFKIFGTSLFSMKIGSALCAFLLFILLCFHVIKNYGYRAAAFCAAHFLILDYCFDYHNFRTGNLDAAFCLIFTVSVISIINFCKSENKLLFYNAFFFMGLAFLTKGTHFLTILAVIIIAAPFWFKKTGITDILMAIIISVIAPFIWFIKRYRYDGTAFFDALRSETSSKAGFTVSSVYLKMLFEDRTFIAFVIILVVFLVIHLIGKYISKNRNSETKITEKKFWTYIINMDAGLYIAWVWMIVPILFFSISGTEHAWYIYPSYIAMSYLTGFYADRLLEKPLLKGVCYFVCGMFLIYSAFSGITKTMDYVNSGSGGNIARNYGYDIESASLNYPEYAGANAYIQNVSRTDESVELTQWHNDLVAYSRIIMDLNCLDGGVEGFLNDESAILILNKSLWDKYSDQLYGYVILQDNEYLIFCNEKY